MQYVALMLADPRPDTGPYVQRFSWVDMLRSSWFPHWSRLDSVGKITELSMDYHYGTP